MQPQSVSDRDLDDFVEAYEAAVAARGPGGLDQFLPPPDHPQFEAIALELMRVDLEHQWRTGNFVTAADYQRRWPTLLENIALLQSLRSEEERQRRQASRVKAAERRPRETSSDGAANDGSENRWPVAGRSESQSSIVHFSSQDLLTITDAVRDLPEVGETFLGFNLREELGRGSFGRVYLAEQTDLARRYVVLKITAFETVEPDRLARLQHTNIVPIYSVHLCGVLRAIVMPFFGRRTLGHALQDLRKASRGAEADQELVSTFQGGPGSTLPFIGRLTQLPGRHNGYPRPTNSDHNSEAGDLAGLERGTRDFEQAVVAVMARIADGLMHAHERGIVHRDLKPANILLADDGQPRLLDFNLSADMSGQPPAIELVGGTLPYMSPEQLECLRGQVSTDERVDIYSLGVIFFELLTGRRPFPDYTGIPEGFLSAMIADRQRGATPLRRLVPTTSVDVASIVAKCLEPEPGRRYASARKLYEDLQRHLEHKPLRHAPNRSLVERGRKWSRRHPLITSTTALVTAIVLISVGVGLIASWKVEHLRRIEARDVLRRFEERIPETQVALIAPNPDLSLPESTRAAREALDHYGVFDSSDWLTQPNVQRLSVRDQQRLRAEVSQLLLLLSSAERFASDAAGGPQSQEKLEEALRLADLAENCFDASKVPKAILLQQAEILHRLGRATEAQDKARQAASRPSQTAMDKEVEALQAIASGRYEHAIPLLEEALSREPTRLALWFSLGNCRAHLKHFGEAENCFSIALTLNPNSYRASFHRGLVRLESGKFAAAKLDFDQVLALEPGLSAAFFNRAIARRGLGDLSGAEDDLSRALTSPNMATRIYLLRAQIRRELGNTIGAADDTLAALNHEPSDEMSYLARGVAWMDSDPEKALADFRSAIRLNPRLAAGYFNGAHVLAERLGQLDAAIGMLNDLLAKTPDDSLALSSRGVLLARGGRFNEALADALKAARISTDPETSYRVACIYALARAADPEHLNLALEHVRLALTGNQQLAWSMAGDSDLKSISGEARYQALLSAALSLQSRIPDSGPLGGELP